MTAERLILRVADLQAPSTSVASLLHMLQDTDADYDEVIAIVGRDPVLTAKVLRQCNSARYGLARRVASLKQAVGHLGFVEIHRIVMRLGFGPAIGAELPGYDMAAGELWQHSRAAAHTAPQVSRFSRIQGVDASVAYTAGLLHDIGKVVIGQALDADARSRIQHLVDRESASVRQAEKEVLGCDHTEVGACLLRQWKIPELLVEAVAGHHAPRAAAGTRLSAVVHVADLVAHQSGASPGWSSFAVAVDEGVYSALNLTSEVIERLIADAAEAEGAAALESGGMASAESAVASAF